MRTVYSSVRGGAFVLALLVSSVCTAAIDTPAAWANPVTYHATGVVRSYSPNRTQIFIAHDAIPGFMAAMTMPFDIQNASQVDGFRPGDRIQFDFVATDDGRMTLLRLQRRP